MTKENFTSINVIIDASGSMRDLGTDTIGGFNGFLADQKNVPGDVVFTLCTFNTSYRLVHDFIKLTDVPNLSPLTYAPQGGTALLDAMGTTMNSVGFKLAAMKEEDRPSKVIFLVITDGFENSSHSFSKAFIRDMVRHQKDKYSWEFVFMGANIDAITEGASLGISVHNTMNYVPSSVGTAKLYRSVSESMTNYRGQNSSVTDFFGGQGGNVVECNPPLDMIAPVIAPPTAGAIAPIIPTNQALNTPAPVIQIVPSSSKRKSKNSRKK